ncbi:MAG: glycoside hydrolase family 43 protein, partial [Verrucomicrobiae bacterium]|nr:glycoside hydrolase family 43 protein [Verrucomicrobiae bacterium]
MRALFFSLTLLALLGFGCSQKETRTYTNPIGGEIRMGDPVILVDDVGYYLYGTTSSNEGFKCWYSDDLINWEERGFAFRKSEDTWAGKTFWAPEAFKYKDRYYLVYSAQEQDSESFGARICLAASDHPDGPFKDVAAPLFDAGYSAIDGHVFVDDDGIPYVYFAKVGTVEEEGKRYLFGAIYGARLKDDLSGLDSEPVLCVQADQPWELHRDGRSRCNEGAFVFKEGGIYFLTYSGNHYAEPIYGIGYATAKSPLGPWVKSPDNPIVSQNTELGISGPGHNCFII